MARYRTRIGQRTYEIEILSDHEVIVDGRRHSVDVSRIEGVSVYSVLIDNRSYELYVEEAAGFHILTGGEFHTVQVEDERSAALHELAGEELGVAGPVEVAAPMPGLVVSILVAPGDEVEAHQGLVILEAMKMENEIRSPRRGRVKAVRVQAGKAVNQGQTLVILE